MTTRRAVTYGGLFCLLAAWLASAASTTFQNQNPPEDVPSSSPSPDALVSDVQAHAARMRQRLASAPVPQTPRRNPFLFDAREEPAPRHSARRIEPPPAFVPPPPAPPPEPALVLAGVAEDQGPMGPVRTAILSDDTEAVFIVTVGQTVLGRYQVEAIGADVVELKDVSTGAIRRLALR
jgi:hypothetical protein